jgi:hypothetical protein
MVRHLVRVLKDTDEMSRSLASYLGTVARLFPCFMPAGPLRA